MLCDLFDLPLAAAEFAVRTVRQAAAEQQIGAVARRCRRPCQSSRPPRHTTRGRVRPVAPWPSHKSADFARPAFGTRAASVTP